MRVVQVKHFLNAEGLAYFYNEWYPRVKTVLKEQEGYVSITHQAVVEDLSCIYLILIFKDEPLLMQWVNTPLHQSLLDALEPYRTRDWLWAAYDSDTFDILEEPLAWESVPI